MEEDPEAIAGHLLITTYCEGSSRTDSEFYENIQGSFVKKTS